MSSDIAKHLRSLASTHNLRIDQWQELENEVMLSILGFHDVQELPQQIEKMLSLDSADAIKLTSDINKEIFEPIREELERELGSPAAKTEGLSDVEAVRAQILGNKPAESASSLELLASSGMQKSVAPPTTTAPAVLPATPPAPPPTEKAVRGAPISSSYSAKQPSHERKSVEGDPYREQIA